MPQRPADVWRVSIATAHVAMPATEAAFEDSFGEALLALSRFEETPPPDPRWRFEALLAHPPTEAQLAALVRASGEAGPQLESGLLQKTDWIARSHGLNPPV